MNINYTQKGKEIYLEQFGLHETLLRHNCEHCAQRPFGPVDICKPVLGIGCR